MQTAMPHQDTAISVSHLSLRYGPVTVLNDVQFSLPAGAVLGVVGRNGAGKSSLLHCLLGLTLPQEGASQILGCPSLALTDAVKARLGYVAQSPELFDWLRVNEQVALVGKLYPGWSSAFGCFGELMRARLQHVLMPSLTRRSNLTARRCGLHGGSVARCVLPGRTP